MPEPRLIVVGPGMKGRLHLIAERLASLVSRTVFHGKGMHRATRLLATVFGPANFAIFEVFDGRRIRIPLSDRYWMPVLLGGSYEPEVALVLSQVLTPETAFIDGGANVGWWSLFASTVIQRADRILAIEASPQNFRRLSETALLNAQPFMCLNAAIWDRSGEPLTVLFNREFHDGSRVEESDPPRAGRRVESTNESAESIRLDDAIELLAPGWERLVLKLDIEGAETRALESLGTRMHDIDLLIFEDHGQAAVPDATRAAIQSGFHVFFFDGRLSVRQIRHESEAQAIKQDVHLGYNFFGCPPRTAVCDWLTRLAKARDAPPSLL